MAEKRPFLSISLLSSGRIDTIERCLASLAPIREKLDTEIIVVDTDPEHRGDVHEILEKYADRIIPFEWCDDFSAARNTGMDAAAGEWFLFVDDDEWFIDADPLVDFLSSPEQEDYHWANIHLRNFKDAELKKSSDGWISRMFRMGRGTRFIGSVHEYFTPFFGKPKNIEALLGHTGYAYASDEEKAAHARRNLRLLEVQMKREPQEVRWVFQAIGEYDDLGDNAKELSLAKKGYRLMTGAKGYKQALIRGAFASSQLRVLNLDERWEDCLDAYRSILSGEPIGKVSRAQMELDAARASYELESHRQAKKHCQKYLEIYQDMAGKPVDEADEFLTFQSNTLRDVNHDYIASMLMFLDISDGEWTSFDRYFDSVKWGSSGDYRTDEFEKNLLFAGFQAEYNSRFVKMVGTFWNDGDSRKTVQTFLSEGMSQGAAEAGNPAYWNLVRAVAEADVSEAVPWDVKILWADRAAEENGVQGLLPMDGSETHAMDDRDGTNDADADADGNDRTGKITVASRGALQEYFRNLFGIINPLLIDPKLWEIGLRRGAILDERIKEIPMERWQACVEGFVRDVDAEFALKMAGLLEETYMGLPDEHYQYFLVRTVDMLAEAENAKRQADEARRQQEARASAQKEMKEIIDALQKKVDELVSAGMIEEADKVLKEIQKYTDMMG